VTAAETTDAVNTIILVVFTVLLFVGLGRTVYRWFEYRLAGIPVPPILTRDVISRGGLGFPFALILTARALGLGGVVSGQLWWSLLTGVPAIIGVATYTYFEFFVIRTGTVYLEENALSSKQELIESKRNGRPHDA
jgi:hypothetical protein